MKLSTNNGTLGNGTSWVACPLFTNNGSVTSSSLNTDTAAHTIAGTGSFSYLTILPGSVVSFASNLKFNGTSIVINTGGTIANSTTLKTTGNTSLTIYSGVNFNGTLNVISGITAVVNTGYTPIFKGTVVIDSGSTLQNNGQPVRFEANVTNNGTIGNGSFDVACFRFTNNSNVTSSNFNFTSGVHILQGTGSINAFNVLLGSITKLGSDHKINNSALNINSGGIFDLSTYKLSLNNGGSIINNGSFITANGTVEYSGNILQQISTTNITYGGLRINNAAGTSLPGTVTVTDTLTVAAGWLNLNGHALSLYPDGYLIEAGGNTVRGNGFIIAAKELDAPNGVNVAGLGAVITSSSNLGITEVKRSHQNFTNLNGDTGIYRNFDINPKFNSGLNATLGFKYDESELNQRVEGALKLYRSTNSEVTGL
ncbi:MAG: hypothetical protein IPL53_20205 [Ignavibacteria bacterium]|nr:hypothetical protein [Ignavibacteria bacterium]